MSEASLHVVMYQRWLHDAQVKQDAYRAQRREWHAVPRYMPPPRPPAPQAHPDPRTAEMQAVVDATRVGEMKCPE